MFIRFISNENFRLWGNVRMIKGLKFIIKRFVKKRIVSLEKILNRIEYLENSCVYVCVYIDI